MPQSHMWAAAPVLDSTDTACIPLQHRVIGAEMGVLRSGVAKPSLASRRRDVPGKSKSCEEGMGAKEEGHMSRAGFWKEAGEREVVQCGWL